MKSNSKTVKSKKSTRKQTLKGGFAQHNVSENLPPVIAYNPSVYSNGIKNLNNHRNNQNNISPVRINNSDSKYLSQLENAGTIIGNNTQKFVKNEKTFYKTNKNNINTTLGSYYTDENGIEHYIDENGVVHGLGYREPPKPKLGIMPTPQGEGKPSIRDFFQEPAQNQPQLIRYDRPTGYVEPPKPKLGIMPTPQGEGKPSIRDFFKEPETSSSNQVGWAIRDVNSLKGKKSKKSTKKSNHKNKLSYLENSVRNMF